MNIVVVGAGAIGKERIKAIERLGENVIIVDPLYSEISFNEALTMIPDWIFVCTPHHMTVQIVEKAIDYNKNVLAEKPLGRDLDEFKRLEISEFDRVNVGFNYRFYKGVRELLKDIKEEKFGDLISVNMTLGLGDAPGTEKTWRLDPEKAGSGAYLDPGVHLVDLAMLISDNTLEKIDAYTNMKFWKTGFQEEWHCIARDKTDCIYNIQASKVRWRNTFRIEVNGTEGYGIVEGRGRNYGTQRYWTGKRWGWQSGLTQRESEYLVLTDDCKDSFYEETKAVLYGCEGLQPATHIDNKRCLEFIL